MKNNKNVKTSTKTTKKPANLKADKAEKVEKTKVKKAPVVTKEEVQEKPVEMKVEKAETPAKAKKPITLNQELNVIIALFSLLTIFSFCFIFDNGSIEYTGWDIFLKSGLYSGVFKGVMVIYVISLFIDCVLSIKVESENEIFNIVEKVLYVCTLLINIIVVAILIVLIKNVGIGLILFMIASIVSAILKLARIYSTK